MRIALAFYGQLRDIDIAFPYWKINVLRPLKIQDIFVHTYREEIDQYKTNFLKTSSFKVGPSVLKQFYELYNPKVVMHSEYEDVKKTGYYFEPTERVRFCVTNPFTFQASFFSLYNVMKLINEYDYDAVIVSRTDTIFVKPIETLPIVPHELLTSTFMYDKNFDGQFWSVSDMVNAGSVETIKDFAEVGVNYKKLYDGGITFHPETLIGENLKALDVNVNPFFKYKEEHYLIRDQKYME